MAPQTAGELGRGSDRGHERYIGRDSAVLHVCRLGKAGRALRVPRGYVVIQWGEQVALARGHALGRPGTGPRLDYRTAGGFVKPFGCSICTKRQQALVEGRHTGDASAVPARQPLKGSRPAAT